MIPIYQCDAFTDRVFGGNPAAVCPLESWLDDDVLAAIALENNLSETAYLVGGAGRYELRWFTPAVEVDLCGHATLASSWVVFERLEPGSTEVRFETRSGELRALRRDDGAIELDFPSRPPARESVDTAPFADALGAAPTAVHDAPYWLAIFATEGDVAALTPDMAKLTAIGRPVVCTAPGQDVDFVSRFFGPTVGVPEDPVTGSAHCSLAPYWAEQLGKTELQGRQISARSGDVGCAVRGDRVTLAGAVTPYLEGRIRF